MIDYSNALQSMQQDMNHLARKPDFSWVCNECDSAEFTSALAESDLEWFACSGCGCDEFHKVYKD